MFLLTRSKPALSKFPACDLLGQGLRRFQQDRLGPDRFTTRQVRSSVCRRVLSWDHSVATVLVFHCERHQGHIARSLDRRGELPLVLGAVSRYAPGNDLPALRDQAAEPLDVLVVDKFDFVGAEAADFPAYESFFFLLRLAYLNHDSSVKSSRHSAVSTPLF